MVKNQILAAFLKENRIHILQRWTDRLETCGEISPAVVNSLQAAVEKELDQLQFLINTFHSGIPDTTIEEAATSRTL